MSSKESPWPLPVGRVWIWSIRGFKVVTRVVMDVNVADSCLSGDEVVVGVASSTCSASACADGVASIAGGDIVQGCLVSGPPLRGFFSVFALGLGAFDAPKR